MGEEEAQESRSKGQGTGGDRQEEEREGGKRQVHSGQLRRPDGEGGGDEARAQAQGAGTQSVWKVAREELKNAGLRLPRVGFMGAGRGARRRYLQGHAATRHSRASGHGKGYC